MNWTPQQDKAIHSKPCTLLVSAAAGSGKTAVLTQRIVEKIADPQQELTVENIAVVTFTKAAANELKERLSQKLSAAAAQEKKSRRLSAQLAALPTARISTIHSFCYTMIRENASLLSLPPTVKIADPVSAASLLNESAKEVLKAYYARDPECSPHDNGDFLLLLELCGVSGDDSEFIKTLTLLYSNLRSYPTPMALLPDACNRLEQELLGCEQGEQSVYQCQFFAPLLQILQNDLALAAEKLQKARETALQIPGMSQNSLEILEGELAHAVSCRDCDLHLLPTQLLTWEPKGKFSFPRNTEVPELVDQVRALRKDGRGLLTAAMDQVASYDEKAILLQLRTTLGLGRVTAAFMQDLDKTFSRRKQEEALLDYADLEQFCARLLCADLRYTPEGVSFEKTEAAKRIAEGICELYVDEYQDTNLIQDVIFRAASRPGRMFMVGDPKQSVYGFRGAKPSIFIRYKTSFAPYSEEESALEQKLMLSNNFRCDSTVIDVTNRIFSLLMNSDPKAPLYTEEDQLIFTKNQDSHLPAELLIADKEEDPESEEISFDDPEALLIARRIRELMQEGFLTEKGNRLRYGDIAILARNTKILQKARKALIRQGIPCTEDADDSFFASPEILFFRSLLRVVDNPFDDIALAAVMNSPIFNFTPDQLYEAGKSESPLPFHRAVMKNAENNEKLADFFRFLTKLRRYARSHPLCETVLYALEQTDTENVYAASSQPARVRKNVRTMLDLAAECSRSANADLATLQEWLDAQSKKSDNTEQADGDRVKLMTIHHSKGLEFPCVFVAGLQTQFNNQDFTATHLFDADLGIAFRVFDDSGLAKIKTPFYAAAVLKKKKEQLEEEKRLLYVALTRARQKLILTAQCQPLTLLKKLYPSQSFGEGNGELLARKANSLWDLTVAGLQSEPMLFQVLSDYAQKQERAVASDEKLAIGIYPPGELTPAPAKAPLLPTKQEEAAPSAPQWNEEELREYLDFEYPFATLSQIPKKVSVSGLSPVTDASAEPIVHRKLEELFSRDSGGAFAGTAAHQFMQFCDFSLARQDCRAEAERLLSLGFLSQEQCLVLRHDRLQEFFASPLYAALSQSKAVHRELRFNVFLPANRILPSATDKEVLLQGVIDCFFENPDGSYTLLDFKTDRAVGEEGRALLRERHSRQLQIYRLAVEKMTGKAVKKICIWSFSLGEALEVEP